MYKKHLIGGNQVFQYTNKHRIVFLDLCLDYKHSDNDEIKLNGCKEGAQSQIWQYSKTVKENN